MREIPVSLVKEKVKAMAMEASWKLGDREKAYIRKMADEEISPVGKQILHTLV